MSGRFYGRDLVLGPADDADIADLDWVLGDGIDELHGLDLVVGGVASAQSRAGCVELVDHLLGADALDESLGGVRAVLGDEHDGFLQDDLHVSLGEGVGQALGDELYGLDSEGVADRIGGWGHVVSFAGGR